MQRESGKAETERSRAISIMHVSENGSFCRVMISPRRSPRCCPYSAERIPYFVHSCASALRESPIRRAVSACARESRSNSCWCTVLPHHASKF